MIQKLPKITVMTCDIMVMVLLLISWLDNWAFLLEWPFLFFDPLSWLAAILTKFVNRKQRFIASKYCQTWILLTWILIQFYAWILLAVRRIGSKTQLTCSLDDRREIHKQNRFDEFVGQAKYYFIIQQLPEPERFVNWFDICKTILMFRV